MGREFQVGDLVVVHLCWEDNDRVAHLDGEVGIIAAIEPGFDDLPPQYDVWVEDWTTTRIYPAVGRLFAALRGTVVKWATVTPVWMDADEMTLLEAEHVC